MERNMSRYTPHKDEVDGVPAICPLLRTCQQRVKDLEEYERLKQKWTKYAESQEVENVRAHKTRILTEKGFASRKRKFTVDWIQEVTGPQVFYLEYVGTKEMSPEEIKALAEAKEERFNKMCPHVKNEELGLITKDPPYLECQIFSEWYYAQKQ